MTDDPSEPTLDPDVERVVVRQLSAADAPEISRLRRDNVEFHERFNLGRPPAEEDEIVAWLASSIQIDLGIWLDGELVGICDLGFWRATDAGLEPVRAHSSGPLVAGIGFVIDEAHANRGLTTAAVRATVAHALSMESVTHFTVPVMTGNVASRRVLEKCGFTLAKAGGDWCVYELHRGVPDGQR